MKKLLKHSLAALALAALVACGGGGGSSPGEVPNANNLAPSNVKLMEVSSNAVGAINASWLSATDDATPAAGITYELHASESAGFSPSDSTRVFSAKGVTSAEITQGITAGRRYFVKLRAIDGQGASTSSDSLDVTVSNTAAQAVAGVTTQRLDAQQVRQVSDNQVVLQAGVTTPVVGGFIASTEANGGQGFLRKVTSVTSSGSGVVVQTAPAALNEVYSDLKVAGTFNLDTIPAEVAGNASQVGLLVRQAGTDAQAQTIEWPQSRFRYTARPSASRGSSMQAGLISTSGFRASEDKSEYGSGKWGQVTGESRIELEAGSSGEVPLSLFITSNNKPWSSLSKVTICSVAVGEVTNYDSSATPNLVSVTTGDFVTKETLTDDLRRITQAEQVIKFSAQKGADAAKPYRVVATAYLDDTGDLCTGNTLGGLWRDEIEFAFDVYVTANSFPSMEEADEEFSQEGSFKVRNSVVTTFSPKLSFEREIVSKKLASAKMLVSASPKVVQTLTIDADYAGTLDATRTIVKERAFRKVYVTPAGIPIVISGAFKMDMRIEGKVTGKMDATERLEIGYDEVSFGVEYVNGAFRPVTSSTPVYELKIAGDAKAEATLKITLRPALELTAYDVLTGHAVLAPHLRATAGIEGRVRLDAAVDFEKDKLLTAADTDYRLTAARLEGGLDTYLYADLSIWDYTLIKYPSKEAQKNDYSTYKLVTLIDNTTLMDLPVLEVQVPELTPGGTPAAHASDTRALRVVATAANVPNPLLSRFPRLPESFTPWRAWTAPKIVDQIGIDKASYRVVADGPEYSDVSWATFTQPGTYTLRVGGYSAWGPWARQYVETTVVITDDDDNGIADWWQRRYSLSGSGTPLAAADPDRDGLNNLEEWQDGTDPTKPDGDPLPVAAVVASPQNLTLGEQFQLWISQAWDAVVKVVYTIQDESATVLRAASDTAQKAFITVAEAIQLGTHTISARLFDQSGTEVGTASVAVTVNGIATTVTTAQDDRTTPAVTIAGNGTTEDTTPVIRGTVSAAPPSGYEVRLFRNGEIDSFGVATLSGLNWSFAVPATQALANGQHSFTAGVVRAVDGSTTAGPPSAAYAFTVQTVGVSGVSPSQAMRAEATDLAFTGSGLPTSGLSINAPGNTRNTCQINAAGKSATGFNATCTFFQLGAQSLQIMHGGRVLGELQVNVTSNITGVTWASGTSTTFGNGTVKFGEQVIYRVAGKHLLADATLGFAVDRCGTSNTEVGTASDVLRTYQCWFNNEAGAVAGQMSGVVKDAPSGQVLYTFHVPVETAPIGANSSIVVSWEYGSVGTPIQGRGTNPRTVAINAGVEIEGFINGPMFDVDVSTDKVRLFNFRSYAGAPGSAVFDSSTFNGLVLRVPSGASWTFSGSSVGSANTLSGLTASRLDAQAQRLAINLGGLGYGASTVVEVAYTRGSSATAFNVGAITETGKLFVAPNAANSCTFTASGTWDSTSAYMTNAAGIGSVTNVPLYYTWNWRLFSAPFMSLIALHGNAGYVYIGNGATLNVSGNKELYFIANDGIGAHFDNGGELTVNYTCQ